MKRILYGICGIGNGHTYRQLPTIEWLAGEGHQVVIFAYGDSLRFIRRHFADKPRVTVLEVAVPYYVGTPQGLDFEASENHARQSRVEYTVINCRAMAEAARTMGCPDVVISDYEPVSAQYAYAYGAPLVTIDQQSKYLTGVFPEQLASAGYRDEVMRLGMFFPKAAARLACSFFTVTPRKGDEQVIVCPPVLRDEVVAIRHEARRRGDNILVYLTAQAGFGQSPQQLVDTLAGRGGRAFDVFVPAALLPSLRAGGDVRLHPHGAADFAESLATCAGIIATAGHGLLSEAMYLGIPVLALPLPLYEQQMNAHVIDRHSFGLAASRLDRQTLDRFITQLPAYARAIAGDRTVLLRTDGRPVIRRYLADRFSV